MPCTWRLWGTTLVCLMIFPPPGTPMRILWCLGGFLMCMMHSPTHFCIKNPMLCASLYNYLRASMSLPIWWPVQG